MEDEDTIQTAVFLILLILQFVVRLFQSQYTLVVKSEGFWLKFQPDLPLDLCDF